MAWVEEEEGDGDKEDASDNNEDASDDDKNASDDDTDASVSDMSPHLNLVQDWIIRPRLPGNIGPQVLAQHWQQH